ncbi:MAG: response regulator [Myxococcales bacterium FL481]|nr:MAG: response regulator [Myxococcales bacterium FL481]
MRSGVRNRGRAGANTSGIRGGCPLFRLDGFVVRPTRVALRPPTTGFYMTIVTSEGITEMVNEGLTSLLGEAPAIVEELERTGELRTLGVSAQVPFTGQVEGVILVAAATPACTALVGEMMGDDEVPMEDVLDGVGEIANVLAGAVKNLFAQEGYSVGIGLPHIHRTVPDDSHHVVSLHSGETTQWHGLELTLCGHPLEVWLGFGAPKAKEEQAPKILVIDSDAASGKQTVRALQQAGYDVSLSIDAVEGIRRAVTQGSDLVFTDIELPGVNGAAVVGALHVILPETSIVVVSALPEADIQSALGPVAGHIKAILPKQPDPSQWVDSAKSLLGEGERSKAA